MWSDSLLAQVAPSQPGGHWHLKPSGTSWHVPPLAQGLEMQAWSAGRDEEVWVKRVKAAVTHRKCLSIAIYGSDGQGSQHLHKSSLILQISKALDDFLKSVYYHGLFYATKVKKVNKPVMIKKAELRNLTFNLKGIIVQFYSFWVNEGLNWWVSHSPGQL